MAAKRATSVRLDKFTEDKLARMAEISGATQTEVLGRAIDKYYQIFALCEAQEKYQAEYTQAVESGNDTGAQEIAERAEKYCLSLAGDPDLSRVVKTMLEHEK